MPDPHAHATHPAVLARLRRAEGHLRHVAAMIEAGEPCLAVATQLAAVEAALTAAKRTLIHDHIDHCFVGPGGEADLAEMKTLAKLL